MPDTIIYYLSEGVSTMENKFIKMYRIMGILGEIAGIATAVYALFKNIDLTNDFYFLMIVLLLLLLGVRILFILKCKGKFRSITYINASMIKGHLSLMLGVSTAAAALMFAAGKDFTAAIAIIVIIIVFISIMLIFMLNTFAKLTDMVKESEKK